MSIKATQKAPRLSLDKMFSVGIACILVVIILLSYFTFNRLLSFQSALLQVPNQALPKLINTSQLLNQGARLLQSTELLTKSSSLAAKRIVQKQIDNNLQAIYTASQLIENNEFLDIQFDTINTELTELSDLVTERLELRNQMDSLKVKVSILGEQASKLDVIATSSWLLDYLQALINVNHALDERRLQRVRFLFDQLSKRLIALNTTTDALQNRAIKLHMIDELNTLLFAQNGLVELKIKTLRLEGRVIGRENFVHYLIEDYVSHLDFIANETAQKTTSEIMTTVKGMEQLIKLLAILVVSSVILLLLISVVFQRRLIKKLKVIN